MNKGFQMESAGAAVSKLSLPHLVSGVAWVAGLILTGSDGSLMPWANILGVLIFICACRRLSREGQIKSQPGKGSNLKTPSPSLRPAFKPGRFQNPMPESLLGAASGSAAGGNRVYFSENSLTLNRYRR